MSNLREAWLCVLQDADGNEETELITIERGRDGSAPVIELTNGARITCTLPATAAAEPTGAGAGSRTVDLAWRAAGTRCRKLGRYEFLFVAATLALAGRTGSPVNPLAIV